MPLQWAMTQHNLGSALGALGEREKDAAKVCEALGHHLAAWEAFAPNAPHYASAAAGGVGRDISSLKANFPQAVDACLDRHKEALARFEEWRKKVVS
ncbi:MAG: hypothetical protein HYU38_12260 [Candidatus Tectomicrobia bacterium]|nr:hypothetical protein [Candidatus Tectomicrobia bacterium]